MPKTDGNAKLLQTWYSVYKDQGIGYDDFVSKVSGFSPEELAMHLTKDTRLNKDLKPFADYAVKVVNQNTPAPDLSGALNETRDPRPTREQLEGYLAEGGEPAGASTFDKIWAFKEGMFDKMNIIGKLTGDESKYHPSVPDPKKLAPGAYKAGEFTGDAALIAAMHGPVTGAVKAIPAVGKLAQGRNIAKTAQMMLSEGALGGAYGAVTSAGEAEDALDVMKDIGTHAAEFAALAGLFRAAKVGKDVVKFKTLRKIHGDNPIPLNDRRIKQFITEGTGKVRVLTKEGKETTIEELVADLTPKVEASVKRARETGADINAAINDALHKHTFVVEKNGKGIATTFTRSKLGLPSKRAAKAAGALQGKKVLMNDGTEEIIHQIDGQGIHTESGKTISFQEAKKLPVTDDLLNDPNWRFFTSRYSMLEKMKLADRPLMKQVANDMIPDEAHTSPVTEMRRILTEEGLTSSNPAYVKANREKLIDAINSFGAEDFIAKDASDQELLTFVLKNLDDNGPVDAIGFVNLLKDEFPDGLPIFLDSGKMESVNLNIPQLVNEAWPHIDSFVEHRMKGVAKELGISRDQMNTVIDNLGAKTPENTLAQLAHFQQKAHIYRALGVDPAKTDVPELVKVVKTFTKDETRQAKWFKERYGTDISGASEAEKQAFEGALFEEAEELARFIARGEWTPGKVSQIMGTGPLVRTLRPAWRVFRSFENVYQSETRIMQPMTKAADAILEMMNKYRRNVEFRLQNTNIDPRRLIKAFETKDFTLLNEADQQALVALRKLYPSDIVAGSYEESLIHTYDPQNAFKFLSEEFNHWTNGYNQKVWEMLGVFKEEIKPSGFQKHSWNSLEDFLLDIKKLELYEQHYVPTFKAIRKHMDTFEDNLSREQFERFVSMYNKRQLGVNLNTDAVIENLFQKLPDKVKDPLYKAFGGNPVAVATDIAVHYAYQALIALKVKGFAIRNTAQLLLTATDAGTLNTTLNLLAPLRLGDYRKTKELLGLTDKINYKEISRNSKGLHHLLINSKGARAIESLMGYIMQASERYNRVVSYKAGLTRVRREVERFRKMTPLQIKKYLNISRTEANQMHLMLKADNIEKAAEIYGNTVVKKTQFPYGKKHSPLVSGTSLGRATTQFQTFALNWTEMMADILPFTGRGGSSMYKAKAIANLAGASTLTGLMGYYLFGMDFSTPAKSSASPYLPVRSTYGDQLAVNMGPVMQDVGRLGAAGADAIFGRGDWKESEALRRRQGMGLDKPIENELIDTEDPTIPDWVVQRAPGYLGLKNEILPFAAGLLREATDEATARTVVEYLDGVVSDKQLRPTREAAHYGIGLFNPGLSRKPVGLLHIPRLMWENERIRPKLPPLPKR